VRRHAKAATAGSISGSAKRTPILVVLTALVLALTASPAMAIETHPFLGNFGSANQPGFGHAEGLAIDQSNGDVLVIDAEANTVSRWHADGSASDFSALGTNVIDGEDGADETPEGEEERGGLVFTGPNQSQIAVDDSGGVTDGDIYVAEGRTVIDVFASTGEYLGQLTAAGAQELREPCGVAVDSTGALYVGESTGADGVHKFVPSANPPLNSDNTANFEFGNACSVAAGAGPSAGSIFVARLSGGVSKLDSSTGALEYVASEGSATTISVDPSDGHLYVAKEGEIVEYDASGGSEATQLTNFGSGSFVQGVAARAGKVYASRSGSSRLEAFGPTALLPEPVAGDVTAIQRAAATLNGTISAAGGPAATCEFQYTSEESFQIEGFASASISPCAPAGPFTGSSVETVSGAASGLSVHAAYRFRLVGTSANGSNPSTPASFETARALSVETGKGSNIVGGSATLNGKVNPEGVAVEECNFEYGETEEPYEHTVPCIESPVGIGAGNTQVSVHADVAGLTPNTLYHFRLAAKNSFGSEHGADSFFGPPRIDASSVSGVTPTEASVQGLLNANGVPTTFVVQYVTEEDFEATGYDNAISVPLGGQPIGAGTEEVEVTQQLSGLTPSTTYHFRFVALNGIGSAEGPDGSFGTYAGPLAGLPDGRVYEQVTPVDKNGAAPSGGQNEVQAALDGSGIVYASHGGIPGGEGSQQFPAYLASRGSNWSTQGLLPPASKGSVGAVYGWSEDLSEAYVGQAAVFGDPVSFFQRDNATRALRAMAIEGAEDLGIHAHVQAFNYVDAGADGSVSALESFGALSPGGASGPDVRNVYVWDRDSGVLRLAGVFNDGSVPTKGTFAGSNEKLDTGGGSNLYTSKHYTQEQHTLSDDGSHFFFRDAETEQLYVRLNPTQPQSALDGDEECTEATRACTVQISASQRAVPDPEGEKPATFMSATPDGSRVFFTSSAKLTEDATTGPTDLGKDLYRYDTTSGVLTDLTPDAGDFNGANVKGVLGASDDGSYVYFAANGVLADGATPGFCNFITFSSPGVGMCSLYLWHDGVTTFIARLQMTVSYITADSANWMSTSYEADEKSARVTPDGGTLLFRSRRQLLPTYNNNEVPQFYRYTAADGGLSCISCNPTGAPPVDQPSLRSLQQKGGSPYFAATLTRNLSPDGKRVFFETAEKLVTSDTNGLKDVYEWEAAGAGSCPSDAKKGRCLYLLSTGTSSEPAYFADASKSGDDAFIFTDQRLVSQDQDQIVDIYDARIGGGLASQKRPPETEPCSSADACKAAGAAPPPTTQSPGSSTFSGPGNPAPCQKGKVRKRSRCVKKSRAQQRKKHHKKRHASKKRG
jgi:sugar lactone lactonase YvrE